MYVYIYTHVVTKVSPLMVVWPPINHVMASNKNIAGPDQTTLVGQCGCGSKLGTPNPSYRKTHSYRRWY